MEFNCKETAMRDRERQSEESISASRMAQKSNQTEQTSLSTPGSVLQSSRVQTPSQISGPASITALQQTVGNQAVMRMIAGQRFDSGRPLIEPLHRVHAKLAGESKEI